MSAAEKLKSHGGRFVFREEEGQVSVVELSYWPQIVAVVKEAERAVEWGRPTETVHALDRALAALDEALS